MLNFLNSIISTVSQKRDELVTVFSDIGRWIPAGLGIGIKRNSEVASLAGMTMAMDVEEAVRNGLDIHSLGYKFPGIGKNIPAGIGVGIESNTKVAVAASGAMAQDVLDITDETLESKGFQAWNKIFRRNR